MPVAACRSRWSETQANVWRNNGDSLPQPFTPRLEDYLSTKRAAESGAGRCSALTTVLVCRFGSEHIIDRVGEVVDTRHRHDNNVAMALTVLRDAEESAAAVFAQIDRKNLSFDLQLS